MQGYGNMPYYQQGYPLQQGGAGGYGGHTANGYGFAAQNPSQQQLMNNYLLQQQQQQQQGQHQSIQQQQQAAVYAAQQQQQLLQQQQQQQQQHQQQQQAHHHQQQQQQHLQQHHHIPAHVQQQQQQHHLAASHHPQHQQALHHHLQQQQHGGHGHGGHGTSPIQHGGIAGGAIQQHGGQQLGVGVGAGGVAGAGSLAVGLAGQQQQQQQQLPTSAFKFLSEMYSPETREHAMTEMAKIRDHEKDMGLYIWHSTGIMTILVQELVAVYPLLNPLTLSMSASSRVSNALTLLQCVASHNDTRRRFLESQMVNFLLPFLSNTSPNKALECARLTALGVIGGLVKNDDAIAIENLLQLEIVPVCLRIMESGSELCKTLATFVIQKILSAEKGLDYMCNSKYPARFTAVATVLKTMVSKENKELLTTRLLRLILRCYSNFTVNKSAREALKTCLPDELRNNTHLTLIESDQTVKKVWRELLAALDDTGIQQQQQNASSNANNNMQGQYSR